MSISSEISRLQSAKSTLKTKINAKNDNEHQITDETIDEYGDFIDTISTGNLTDEEYEEADDDLDDILENTTVPSGTISITANGEYDVTNYVGANVSIVSEYNAKMDTSLNNINSTIMSLIKNIPNISISGLTSLNSLFNGCRSLEEMPLIDTSNITSMQFMFGNCVELTEIPLLNTSNVTNMGYMFMSCNKLKKIPLLNTSNVTDISRMFNGCLSLTDVPELNLSKVTSMQNMFSQCINLSNDSLNNILAMCTGATSYTGTKTLRYMGLSSAQATTCQGLSNYQAFLNAGWTTGY